MSNEPWNLIKQTGAEWLEDNAAQMGAALAYFCVLSLAPLLIIALSIAGAIFGAEAARGELVTQIDGLIGHEGASAIQEIIAHAELPADGISATLIGAVILLFGAAGVFDQLQSSLNTIWDVQTIPGRWVRGFVIARFLSFAMVVGTGFLLLVSLTLSAVVHAMIEFGGGVLPGAEGTWLVANTVVSFGVITLLIALVFKIVPDVKIRWKDVWLGAALTALLFMIGKSLLGLYLSRRGIGTPYGAAGSLVVFVVWTYYSAQVLFFGAEFTQVYAKRCGAHIVPAAGAEHVVK